MSRGEGDTLEDAIPPWSRVGGQARRTGLRRWLHDGIAGDRGMRSRREVGLPERAEDREVARALVHAIAAREVPAIRLDRGLRADPRALPDIEPVGVVDRSFLGRLDAAASSPGEIWAPKLDERESDALTVASIDDVRTLLAVMRGGTVWQRRAAALRLAERLAQGKGVSGAEAREAVSALDGGRDVENAYERQLARERLSGAPGRKARSEREEWERIAARTERDLHAYWDGERELEPVTELPGEQRAQLLLRVRDMSDRLVGHLASLIEGVSGPRGADHRSELLSSLRYAGDPRLVPPLRTALEGDDRRVVLESARALSRIDDPRVWRALRGAYDRSVVESEHAVLAGALGMVGDVRGRAYVRELLRSDDVPALLVALEALESLGTTEDCEHVAEFLSHDEPAVVAQTVRTLGGVGDGRALPALAELRERTRGGALRAAIEDAEASIHARMELRGEEVSDALVLVHGEQAARNRALAERQDPAIVRFSSWKDTFIGYLWLAIGGLTRAVRRFEAAAARREGWAPPLVAMAMAWARAKRPAQALVAFRRALDADARAVEENYAVIRVLVQTFLRRAEEMERDGRYEIALGLLDELLSRDLRQAPSALRFEVERKRSALRQRERDDR